MANPVVLIDGKPQKVLNNIKIIWADDEQELHLTANYQGIVLDAVENGEVVATKSQEAMELRNWELIKQLSNPNCPNHLLSCDSDGYCNCCGHQ